MFSIIYSDLFFFENYNAIEDLTSVRFGGISLNRRKNISDFSSVSRLFKSFARIKEKKM